MAILDTLIRVILAVSFFSPFYAVVFWPEAREWYRHRQIIRNATRWREEV